MFSFLYSRTGRLRCARWFTSVFFLLLGFGAAHAQLVVNVPAGGDIQSASLQVLAAGGGTINLAAGNYYINGSIILGSNTTLNGAGGPGTSTQSVIYAPQTPNAVAMVTQAYAGASNLTISNLVLDGNIPQAAMLYGTGGGNYAYDNDGILIYDTNTTTVGVNLTNVEVRHTLRGILTGLVDNLTISGCYFHDNNPGGFSHNMYLVATSGVEIDHTRSNDSLLGDGLHIDFGGQAYTIRKSEFSRNNGLGILSQQDNNVTIEDTRLDFNTNEGIQIDAGGMVLTRDTSSYNGGYGLQIPDTADNAGLVNGYYSIGNDPEGVGGDNGPDYVYGAALIDFTEGGPGANAYPAMQADGVIGATDTGDWTLNYPGYSFLGAVDFNANHLTNGSITFHVGNAIAVGAYPLVIRYSNGTSSTQTMNLSVNGSTPVAINFPSTGSYSTWATVTASETLNVGDNPVTLSVPTGATSAPELDLLTVTTPQPPAPNAPTSVTAVANGPYSVTLNWTPPANTNGNAAQTYNIYKNNRVPIVATRITGTTWTDTRIFYGETTNQYFVTAVNQGGESGASNTVTVTTGIDAPPGLQVSVKPGIPANNLSWLGVSGAATYIVRRSTATGGPYQTVGTVVANTPYPSFSDTSVSTGVTYYYVVAAQDASNTVSANSYEVVALPQTFTLAASAPSVDLSSITPDTISVVGTNGFSDAVNFTISGLPTGVAASFSTTSGSSTQVTFTANSSAVVGNYPVTITGTDGNLTSSVGITVVVGSGQLAQVITFSAIPQQAVGNTLTVSATASSGLPVSFSVVQNGICSISGNVVRFLNGGACGVVAAQAGNAHFSAAANVGQLVQVGAPNPQTINFTAISTQAAGTGTGLSATASSGLPVTFASNTPSVCTVSGSIVTSIAPGTCTVAASQAGGGAYGPATVTQNFFVIINTSISLTATPSSTSYGQAVALNATVLDANNNPATTGSVTFSVYHAATNSATTFATASVNPTTGIASTTTTTLPAGSDVVIAVYLGASTYQPSGTSGPVIIAAATTAPTLSWTPATTTIYSGVPLDATILNAAFTSPGNVTYTAQLLPSGTPFTVTTSSVLSVGSYTLTATLSPPDTGDYTPVTLALSFTVQNMNIFIANGPGTVTTFYNNGTLQSSAVAGGGTGAAVDASGSVWSITASGNSLSTFSDTGTLKSTYTTGGISGATALAIDGAGTVWVTNAAGSISAVNSTGTAVFAAPVATAAGLSQPASVSVDTAGSLWIANSGSNTVTEVIGVAAPVTTPTVNAVVSNTLATQP